MYSGRLFTFEYPLNASGRRWSGKSTRISDRTGGRRSQGRRVTLRDLVRITEIQSLSDRKQPAYRAVRRMTGPFRSPCDDMQESEVAAMVQEAVSRLRTRDAQIIRLRYGFDGCPPQTLEEIGHLFGITREAHAPDPGEG